MKQIRLLLLTLLAIVLPTTVWAQDEVPDYEVYIDGNCGVAYEYIPSTDTIRVACGGIKHIQESEFAWYPQTVVYKNTISSVVVIPESLIIEGKTYTVTCIGLMAFYELTHIQSITIPKTVRFIEGYALKGCTGLNDIYLYANPKKLAWSIEGEFFGYIDGLSDNIRIHVIGAYLERYKSKFPSVADKFVGDLQGEVDPDFNDEEEDDVISGTTGDLTWKLEPIGTLDTSLGKRTEYCLTIDGWGDMPNYENTGSNYEERREVYNRPWDEHIMGITEIVIGDNVRTIGMYAFRNSPVKKVNFPEGLTMIQQYAFGSCHDLKSIHLPASLKTVWFSSFFGNRLEELTIADGNPYFEAPAGSNAIINRETHELIMGTGRTVIPTSVTSIGERAFQDSGNLESLVIPSNVTTIGVNAFLNCHNLTRLTIGSGVTYIKTNAFWYSNALATVYCYANPNELTWDGHDNNRFFLESNKATKFHVPADYLDDWKTKFPDINATYVGDLIVGPVTVIPAEEEGVEAGKAVTTASGVTISLGADDIIDKEDGSVTVKTTLTPDEVKELLKGAKPDDPNFYEKFKGIYSYMSAGSGVMEVTFETLGDYELTMMTSSGKVETYTKDTKGTITITYEDNEWVFIFASLPAAARAKMGRAAIEGGLKIYSVKFIPGGAIPGDANNDGTVNAADIVEVVNYIMGTPSDNYNEGGADANGDGVVNAADIVAIVNMIMGN